MQRGDLLIHLGRKALPRVYSGLKKMKHWDAELETFAEQIIFTVF